MSWFQLFLSAALLSCISFVVRSSPPASGSHLSDEFAVYMITAPSAQVAKDLSHGLVLGRLAACVNIVPSVQSVYIWDGKVQTENEHMLVVKSWRSLLADLQYFLKSHHHPYNVPELIELPIAGGGGSYLSFLNANTADPGQYLSSGAASSSPAAKTQSPPTL